MSIRRLTFLLLATSAPVIAMTFPQTPIKSYDCDTCSSLSKELIQTAWGIEDKPLNNALSNEQRSVWYQKIITGKALNAGFKIHTQGKKAVIRVENISQKNPIKLTVQAKNQPAQSVQAASTEWSSDALPFSKRNHLIFQLKPDLGQGSFILKTVGTSIPDDAQILVHVLDKYSATYLSLTTNKSTYVYGDELVATIQLRDEITDYPIDDISATLTNPEGKFIALSVERVDKNTYQAKANLLSEMNPKGENWTVETSVTSSLNNETVTRQGHTAFSYAIPSAAVREITPDPIDASKYTADIEVATASRYALQAILYQIDGEGKKHPVQIAESADWLAIGKQSLTLAFNPPKAQDASHYVLGDIQLIDYGQIKSVFSHHLS
jgi:hypothetical protein